MVGEGVLRECLAHPDIGKILVINRRSCNISDPKLTEIIIDNFFEISLIENQLIGYDACFYCLGITSFLVKESQYYNVTYRLTVNFADLLSKLNPGMIFCYVSGFGADSEAKLMQTRIKGITESALFKLQFKKVYSFRPGLMKPLKGQKHVHRLYYLFIPFYPLLRLILPGFILTLKELGYAMINSVLESFDKQILEVRDIVTLAK